MATRLWEAGVAPEIAMRLLGHADYATTIKLYTHISNQKLREAGTKLEKCGFENKVAKKLPAEPSVSNENR